MEKNQPYTGVWIKEGHQRFEEEAVSPWVSAAAATDIANAINADKDSGKDNGSKDDSNNDNNNDNRKPQSIRLIVDVDG